MAFSSRLVKYYGHAGTVGLEYAYSNALTQYERAKEQIEIQASNRKAQMERAKIGAESAMAAASARALDAATASQRLLTEFEAGLAQKRALRERQTAQALGSTQAQFGAAGVQSSGALREAERQTTLAGNIQESQANMQRENILQQARAAIQGAYASGTQASANLDAASIFGKLATKTGYNHGIVRIL